MENYTQSLHLQIMNLNLILILISIISQRGVNVNVRKDIGKKGRY
jgi:hypothetical protein